MSSIGASAGASRLASCSNLAGGRARGPDPLGRSYQTYASSSDPGGNGWLLQEIKTRLPDREWAARTAHISSRAPCFMRPPSITILSPPTSRHSLPLPARKSRSARRTRGRSPWAPEVRLPTSALHIR
jgi:hypothetical protein